MKLCIFLSFYELEGFLLVNYNRTFLRYGIAGMRRMNQSDHRKTQEPKNISPLQKWLNENLSHPYPTKGEKIILAIISQ